MWQRTLIACLSLFFVIAQTYTVVPGDQFLGRGFDLAYGTTHPVNPEEATTSFSKTLLFTFDADGVVSTKVSSGTVDVSTTECTSLDQVTKEQSASASAKIKLIIFGFEASGSFKSYQNTLTSSASRVIIGQCTVLTNLITFQKGNLTTAFQLDVSNLPGDYWDDPSAYRNFIARYGTHWIESVVLGGKVAFRSFYTASYYEQTKQKTSDASVGASIWWGFSISASGSYSKSDATYVTMNASSFTSSKYGYGGDFTKSDNYTEWMPTVEANPMPINFLLSSYTPLIADIQKRESMELALQEYIKGSLVSDRYLMGSARIYTESTTVMTSPFNVYRPTPDAVVATAAGSQSSQTSYNSSWSWDCPNGQVLNKFIYRPSILNGDAKYGFGCLGELSANSLCNAKTSNDLGGDFAFYAPEGSVVTGIDSTFDPDTKKRTFKVSSCTLPSGVTIDRDQCLTSDVNALGRLPGDFACPDLAVITGVFGSREASNMTAGMLWGFTCCTLSGPLGVQKTYSIFGDAAFVPQSDEVKLWSVAELKPSGNIKDAVDGDAVSQPLMTNPAGWTNVWGAAPGVPFYVWNPVCLSGFLPLAQVITTSNQQPATTAFNCIHERCASGCSQGPLIWQNGNYRVYSKISKYGDIDLNSFVATLDPTGQTPVGSLYCLRQQCLSPTRDVTFAHSQVYQYWEGTTLTCDDNGTCTTDSPIIEDNSLAIGLGVGLTLSILLIIAVIVGLLLWRRRQQKRKIKFKTTSTDAELKEKSPKGRAGTNPFAQTPMGGDSKITGPTGVKQLTHVEDHGNGYVINKAPEVGARCMALYVDGKEYEATIEAIEKNRIYVAWTQFPGQKDYVATKNVRVIANTIAKKK